MSATFIFDTGRLEAAIESWRYRTRPGVEGFTKVSNYIAEVCGNQFSGKTVERARNGAAVDTETAASIAEVVGLSIQDPAVGEPTAALRYRMTESRKVLEKLRSRRSPAWKAAIGLLEKSLDRHLGALKDGCVFVPPGEFHVWVEGAYRRATFIHCTSVLGFLDFWKVDDSLGYGARLLKCSEEKFKLTGQRKTIRVFFIPNFLQWYNENSQHGDIKQVQADKYKMFEIQKLHGVEALICETSGNSIYASIADRFSDSVKEMLGDLKNPLARMVGQIEPDIAILDEVCDSIVDLNGPAISDAAITNRVRMRQRLSDLKKTLQNFDAKIELDLGIIDDVCDPVLNLPYKPRSEKELQGIFFIKESATGGRLYNFYQEIFDQLIHTHASTPWQRFF